MLHHQIKTPETSDLIYGYDDGCSTKAGCFFKFNSSAVSEKKRMAIPKNREGRFTALELYSGAGGFSLGLKDAGFCVTHHVDNDTAACSTLQANFQDTEVLQYDVEDFLIGCLQNSTSRRYPKVGSITLLHGSSPCQGFSRANRNGGTNDAANNAETYRFIDVVKHFQPPFVTFENVEGIADKKNRCYVQQMNAEFLKMEYQIRLCCITASDYGDPQNRNRIFILAAKKGFELPHLPRPTHGDDNPSLEKRKTVEDALGFLEDIPPLEYEGEVRAELNGRSLDLQGHKLRFAERNKDDIQLVAGNPAPTVIKKRVIRHYTNNKRPLTRLEHSLLQSFPPTYLFKGTDSEIRDQIGNAVPVCLARAIGRSVIEAIRRSGG
jgi:DNA (cytosine-5)-methyltransferase 1